VISPVDRGKLDPAAIRCNSVAYGGAMTLRWLWGISVVSAVACSQSASDRFSVDVEGDRFFVREKKGWFSMLFPCRPSFSSVALGDDQLRLIHAACTVDSAAYSITFGRFKVPDGAAASLDQIYSLAERGMNQSSSLPVGAKMTIAEATIADRPARRLTYSGVPGGLAVTSWILWAEEQQAIYQVMVIGNDDLARGERIIRSMLVPSP
jgi:hypothetical protein